MQSKAVFLEGYVHRCTHFNCECTQFTQGIHHLQKIVAHERLKFIDEMVEIRHFARSCSYFLYDTLTDIGDGLSGKF